MKKGVLHLVYILVLIAGQLNGQSLFESAISATDSITESPLSLNGFTRSIIYGGTNPNDELYLQSIYSQFGLISNVQAGKYGEAFSEIRYRRGNEFGGQVSELELREAYVSMYIGPVTLTAGKQIFSWGAGSFLNPTDQSTPMNPTYRSPDSDDLRIGRWALQSRIQIANQSYFEAIWFPYHQPSVMITEPFNFPDNVHLLDPENEDLKFSNSSFRLNYDMRSTYLDLGLSFYHGYRNNPLLIRDTVLINMESMNLDRIDFLKKPYLINNVGLNLSIPAGNYLFRAEAAYLNIENNDAIPLSPFDEISYIAEVEQSGNNVTLIGGYYGKYILDFEKSTNNDLMLTGGIPALSDIAPPGTTPDGEMINGYLDTQAEGFNRLYNYQTEEFYHSVYLNLTFSLFYDQLVFDLPGIYNFTAGEFTFMPSMAYNITDGLTLKTGFYYMHGKVGSLYEAVGPVLNAGYLLFELKF